MAVVDTTPLAKPSTGSIFAPFFKAWTQYSVYARTLNELDALSERELEDVGLARSDLRRVAWETALKA